MLIKNEIEAVRQEAVAHLRALLRFDTTNPPGNETPAVEYLASVLEGAGYEAEIFQSSPGRGSVVARLAGTGERRPLLLYSHVDVVTAEPLQWSRPPFSGDVADGCVWGRGAIDMKAMVIQELMTMLLLKRSGVSLSRDVIFAATADEEVGGEAGMGFLVDHHRSKVDAEYGLSEGGGTTMYLAGKPFYDIRTAEKGTCRFRLRARGSPGHGSVPRAQTAVEKLAEATVKLSRTRLPFRGTATSSRLIGILGEVLGVPLEEGEMSESNMAPLLDMLPHDFAQYLHAITHDTAVVTGLRAGRQINVIPGEAEALVDGRYLAGQTPEGFFAEIRQVIGPEYEIEPIDVGLPQEDLPGGSLYDAIVAVLGRNAPEATVLPMMMAGATDARHVARMGTKCLGFGPLLIDEGFPIDQLVHGHDERVPLEGFIWGTRVLHEVVREFCSL